MSTVYEWVDAFQFSRSKKHIARDFSDAVLLAELLAQLFPAWVELHNYPGTNRFQQKLTNWETLNRKVLTRIKCEISRKQQEDLANAVPGAIELLLAQVRKQTAKNEQQKANFKTPASPTAKPVEAKQAAGKANTGLKSPTKYKAVEPRTASLSLPEAKQATSSARSPQKLPAAKVLALTPSTPACPAAFTLSDFLPSTQDRPDQDDIASSFSKILQLMATGTGSAEGEPKRGAQSSKLVKPKATAPPAHARQPLTPEHKASKQTQATVARARPSSADSRARLQRSKTAATLAGNVSPPRIRDLNKAKPAAKVGRDYSATKRMPASASNGRHDAAKTEFAESSLVYFSCHEEPSPSDEALAWEQSEHIQVARFVKSLPSGDCLVQLLKADASARQSQSSVRLYVSTPHFIECCSSQLHTMQRMKFDATLGKWTWHQFVGSAPGAQARRDLAIDIAPSAYAVCSSGPRTAPSLTSRRHDRGPALLKTASQNAHFFTEVLSRVKCNSVSLEEPVVVVDASAKSSSGDVDATPCPDFVQTMYDAIGFETPVAPTVFPKVHVDFPLAVLDKKPLRSPSTSKTVSESVLETV